MSGGIIQLVAYGKEDLFLTRDPQITFFKIIYRRYTNFCTEEVVQYFVHNPDFGKKTTCIVSPEGDLVDGVTIKVTLPAIQKFQTDTQFAWVKRIGYAMIKSIEVEINERIVDTHYGEWMNIFSSLTSRNLGDGGLDKLIGNVPLLTEFSNSKPEYIMYIPLQFWFCRTSGCALPMVSLQYSDVKINVEFYPLDQCYFLIPDYYIRLSDSIVNFKQYEYLYQQTPDGISRFGMFYKYDVIEKKMYYMSITSDKLTGVPYDGDPTLLDQAATSALLETTKADKYLIYGNTTQYAAKPGLGVKSITAPSKSLKNVTLKNCVLLVDYVYLDEDERFRFAQTKQDYIIEQLYFTPSVSVESTNKKVKLEIDQPCKLTVWLAQLDYISNYNDRFNYTDSHILAGGIGGVEVGKTLFEEETIKLNSQDRLGKQQNIYYEYLQPYQHTTNRLPNGCGMYSYALFPTDVQPSGTTNMSQIELIELFTKMNYKININNKAKFRSYSLSNNVWRVNNGLSALVFIR